MNDILKFKLNQIRDMVGMAQEQGQMDVDTAYTILDTSLALIQDYQERLDKLALENEWLKNKEKQTENRINNLIWHIESNKDTLGDTETLLAVYKSLRNLKNLY
ncbi:hypothetical protein FDJ58_gp096 [Bacillus phage SIOphi]|uniref:Uncharacterized protein n=1 Tax=Bacillus phage SIOphi TaxID=1285382 RepID=R4JK71_9CAUD|nr:hypothetical protein FDJ58_gp096 [Bacillus phage SIOphi]AGK86904.1 hypothetical protein SIOphi_00480 [Bacillus phage SIOphi]